VSPVTYELGFYIPEEDILHSHGRENHKMYDLAIRLQLMIIIFWQTKYVI
jgi:hypothetical protein